MIYNLKSSASGFVLGKFDEDLNLLAAYNLTKSGGGYSCDCPASARTVKLKPCKHQRMLRVMVGAVNLPRFYDPETGNWSEPIGQGFIEADPVVEPAPAAAPKELAHNPQTTTPVVRRRI